MAQRYTDAEVEEILRRAIQRQQQDDSGVSHDDLVAAAGEIGIDATDVEAAVAEVQAGKASEPVRPAKERQQTQDLAEVDLDDEALLAQDRHSRRARFGRHLATYVVINAFLAGMNLLTGGTWWFLWVVLGWGIGVALQGLGLLLPEDPRRRKNRARRLRRRHEREMRRDRGRQSAAQHRSQRKEREKDFERAVQQGVGLLLSTAARKIAEAVERHQAEEAQRKGGVRVEIDDDKVRVEVPREEQGEQSRDERADDAHKQRR